MARTTDERLDCLMEQLEKGTQNIFESGRYAEYLAVMSKFHHYSFRNTILIFLQNPNASHVAGFHAWKKDFGRSVKAGEHGIQILAPCPKRKWMDHDKIDPATGLPVKDENGNTMQERTIITIPRYRVVTVFDVSQTEGKELPSLGVAELYGDVPNYLCRCSTMFPTTKRMRCTSPWMPSACCGCSVPPASWLAFAKRRT